MIYMCSVISVVACICGLQKGEYMKTIVYNPNHYAEFAFRLSKDEPDYSMHFEINNNSDGFYCLYECLQIIFGEMIPGWEVDIEEVLKDYVSQINVQSYDIWLYFGKPLLKLCGCETIEQLDNEMKSRVQARRDNMYEDCRDLFRIKSVRADYIGEQKGVLKMSYKEEVQQIQARIHELCDEKEKIDNELKELWERKTRLMENELSKLSNQ